MLKKLTEGIPVWIKIKAVNNGTSEFHFSNSGRPFSKCLKSDEIYSKIVRFVFFKISILLQTHRYQTKNMVYVVI